MAKSQELSSWGYEFKTVVVAKKYCFLFRENGGKLKHIQAYIKQATKVKEGSEKLPNNNTANDNDKKK